MPEPCADALIGMCAGPLHRGSGQPCCCLIPPIRGRSFFRVIDSGRRADTYKLALLIALLDLCARHGDADGRAPRLLYTRDIAEQVAVLY